MSSVQAWVQSSLRRIFADSTPPTSANELQASARDERLSFQVGVRGGDRPLNVAVDAAAGEGLEVEVRHAGMVPLQQVTGETPFDDLEIPERMPSTVPDPLLVPAEAAIRPGETHAFWVTIHVDPEAVPGLRDIQIQVDADRSSMSLTTSLDVRETVLPARRDFPVTNWLKANAIVDWYRTPMTEEAFWRLLPTFASDMSDHGQDTVFVPLITPTVEQPKRPTQLLGVSREGDSYRFDWALVERWVKVCRAHGLTRFEWPHLFSQWGAVHAPDVYESNGEDERALWPQETPAESTEYRSFLEQFLPELRRFLETAGILDRSYFHLSDEPRPGDLNSYRKARELIRSLAPWMKVMDALSDISFFSQGLIDIPIPLVDVAPRFVREGAPAWAYFCCIPRGRYLNRFLDTPLVKIRMSGWILYKMQAKGFLHWGYNYWYRAGSKELLDPFTVTDAMNAPEWPAGDPFIVYPGPAGPIDSIRWEIFAESLQDLALLQASGIDPDHPLLDDIRDYAEFPRDERWIAERRGWLLNRIDSLESH